jgi:CRP-like cAMP-binding protein
MTDLLTLLENGEVLGKFTPNQIQQLALLAAKRVLKRDEVVCWQGDLSTSVLLIASGQLRSVIRALDGRSFVVSTWEKGEEFWPHTLFDGEPMPSTLEAVRKSVIFQWDGESVLRNIIDNPDAIRALFRRQTVMIRRRREKISDLAFQPVAGRLAKLLLERFPASESSAHRDLTLDQIATMVASSPEVVCRTLYQFQNSGMIQVTRASITFHDRDALERLVSMDN